MAEHTDRVRTLFDSKAAGWPGKYAAGGRLTGRLSQLARAVRQQGAAGGELLDLGCGSGELARHLAAAGYRVTGCDIAPQMLNHAVAADSGHAVRWIGLEPDWRALPLTAASMDLVVAASVLEYVRHPAVVLSECARVLRPSGVLLCTVPDVTHPVRWLEWPLRLAARTPLASLGRRFPGRAAQYADYLSTSRLRRARWWHAASRQAGLMPVKAPRGPRQPLRLLVFTRPGITAGNGPAHGGSAVDHHGNH